MKRLTLITLALLLTSNFLYASNKGVYYCEFINSVNIDDKGKVGQYNAAFYKNTGRNTKFKLDWQDGKVTFSKTAPFTMYPSNTYALTQDNWAGFEVSKKGLAIFFYEYYDTNIFTLVHSKSSHMGATATISKCEKF